MALPTLDISTLSRWIEARFSQSPGPGGQNVNKVNTRVTLLFDFVACSELSGAQKTRIGDRLSTRISSDGRLRVVSRRERSQARNRRAAEARLLELLAEATHEAKTRRPTRPTAGSRERRLAGKRKRSEIVRARQRRPTTDD
ncbi:MAG: aminoacyl-tRNA hydrolase [Planctomycetes bacterium]|nr:aminoacyl-tRNA hydrolase [Planctomycetota bacterium]